MKSVDIDRGKRLRDEPHTGHNRWHPDIPPVLEADPGEEIVLGTRDASDGQIIFGATEADAASHADYFVPPQWAAPRRFIATMGMPVRDDGVNEGENLTLAARNALLNMIALLQERGWTREQAYILCSVAVDLRVSNVVDVPNFVVSAILPEEIFGG